MKVHDHGHIHDDAGQQGSGSSNCYCYSFDSCVASLRDVVKYYSEHW